MSTGPPVFLVLGATGTLGKELLPLILRQFISSHILVASSSSRKAQAFCDELNGTVPGVLRAKPVGIDVGSQESLDKVPRFNVLVNLLTTNRMLERKGVAGTADMILFAASRGAHYVDADADLSWSNGAMEQLQKQVGSVAPVALVGTGVNPGFIAPMMRAAAARLSSCESIRTAILATAPPSSADDLVYLSTSVQVQEYRRGRWRWPRSMRAVNFGGENFFVVQSMKTAELEPLPAELGVKECAHEHAMDYTQNIAASKAMCWLCCVCCPWRKTLAKRSMEAALAECYARHPRQMTMQCEAQGTNAEGQECRVMLRMIDSEGSYHCTAVCMLSTLEQILDGTLKGGVPPQLGGLAIDTEKALQTITSKVNFEEILSMGPPQPVVSKATSIARSALRRPYGALSFLFKLLILVISFWAASRAQWQADKWWCQNVLWMLESYVCYYAVWMYVYVRVVLFGCPYEKLNVAVRWIDMIWIIFGFWPWAIYVICATSSMELDCHPASPHGWSVLLFATVANTVDMFVLQMRMYTADEWNVILSAAAGGVSAREPPGPGGPDEWLLGGVPV